MANGSVSVVRNVCICIGEIKTKIDDYITTSETK